MSTIKKIAIVFFYVCFALPFALPAQEAAHPAGAGLETALSIGFEFGNTFEHRDSETNYSGSPGSNFDGYFFWSGEKNGKIGMFLRGAWMFPVLGEDAYDFQGGWMIGPAFRIALTDRLALHTGIAPYFGYLASFYSENDKDYTNTVFNFGIGADAGLKFDITNVFFIKGGVNVSWTFLGFNGVQEKMERRDWRGGRDRGDWDGNQSGYWTLNANPYISFGINIFSPKREKFSPKREKKEREPNPPNQNRPRLGKPPQD